MVTRLQIRRTEISGAAPSGLQPGELAFNEADLELYAGDGAGNTLPLFAVRTFSTASTYSAGMVINHAGTLYRALGTAGPGVFAASQWARMSFAGAIPADGAGALTDNGAGVLSWTPYATPAQLEVVAEAAQTGISDAGSAADAAQSAQSTANTGVANAAAAQTSADEGIALANAAQASANQGIALANAAQATANTGVFNAATAQTSANNALLVGQQAGQAAGVAQTTANNGVAAAAAAQTSANSAGGVANQAVTLANGAQTTANTALANAAAAQTTANAALSNASTAQAAANNGISNAAAAQTTANSALAAAQNAQTAASGSGTVTATGTTTARSLAARFSDIANVLDFGADRTGSQDSAAAFRAAFAASEAVYAPAGSYAISSPIICARGYASLRGDGPWITTLVNRTSNQPTLIGSSSSGGGSLIYGFFSGFSLARSAGSSSGGDGFRSDQYGNMAGGTIAISNVTATGNDIGFNFSNGALALVTNCVATGNGSIGISVNDGFKAVISNCNLSGNGSGGPFGQGGYIAQNNAAASQVTNCLGFMSKNSGVLTLNPGQATVTVSHGLAGQPLMLQGSPIGPLPAGWYFNSLTNATFDVVFSTPPSQICYFTWTAGLFSFS